MRINFNELKKHFSILPETQLILDSVRKVSGKDIEFQLDDTIQVDGTVKIARKIMPYHILRIKSSVKKNLNHIISHECGHIIRMYQANESERKIPALTGQNRTFAINEIDQDVCGLATKLKEQLYDLWINGIILQVYNLPVDVRIEQWIYQSYPGLRTEQLDYLTIMVNNSLQTISPEMKELTPKKVFHCNASMLYAFLKGIGNIMGTDFTKKFQSMKQEIEMGELLNKSLEAPDLGFIQYIETTNHWAKLLQINNWFTWIDFEYIPEDYYL